MFLTIVKQGDRIYVNPAGTASGEMTVVGFRRVETNLGVLRLIIVHEAGKQYWYARGERPGYAGAEIVVYVIEEVLEEGSRYKVSALTSTAVRWTKDAEELAKTWEDRVERLKARYEPK